MLFLISGAGEALPVYREGIERARRRGAGRSVTWTMAECTWPLFDLGRWDELLETVSEIEADAEMHGVGQSAYIARTCKARVLFYRGDVEGATAISAEILPRAREVRDSQILVPALSLAALVEQDPNAAVALVEESLLVDDPLYPDVARVCIENGALDVVERMAEPRYRSMTRTHHIAASVRAMLAEARGETDEAGRLYAEAARRWTEHPYVLERGLALLGVARATGGAEAAREAGEIFRSVGAHALEIEAAA
jgi:hypothetical protein